MIKIESLDIAVAGETLLEEISVIFHEGSLNVITGSNGIGKSSFLKSIYSFNDRMSSMISYNGMSMEEMTHREKRLLRLKVGIVEQQPYFFKYLKVKDNISYRCENLGMSKTEISEKMEEIPCQRKFREGNFSE